MATTIKVYNSFKMTEKCLLPDGWDVVTFEDVCAKAINGGTPSTEVEKYWEGDIPWITGADILNQKVSKIRRYITDEAVRNSSTNVIPKGNLLVVTRTGVGKLAIAPFDVAVSQDFTGIIPNEKIETEFLFWLLNNSVNYFLDLTQGTSINGITRKDLMGFVSPIPPLPEQHHIAAILSTIDSAIEQTEAIIAKQQRIKTGLMQDLLTRGIDEHGNLRSEETHEFKDSPLGRIPVEWEVKRLSELVDEGITYGIVQAGPNIENGVPYIRTGDMAGETINAAQLLKTSERIAKSYKRSAVFSGDIVFALRATVGKVLPVSKELEGSNLTQGTAKISPKKSIESTFLLWALQTALVQDQIRLHQKGTTFMEITLADLRSIEVALPIMQDEQSSISEKLTKHDDLRLQYIKNRQKLRALKTALMQDLLTGEVRVTPLLSESQEVSA